MENDILFEKYIKELTKDIASPALLAHRPFLKALRQLIISYEATVGISTVSDVQRPKRTARYQTVIVDSQLLFTKRTDLGLNQAEVAEGANVSRGYISVLENQTEPIMSTESAKRIAAVLGLDFEQFVVGEARRGKRGPYRSHRS